MSSSAMMGVVGVFSFGVGMLVLLVFWVAIATVVRRHRPDVAPILLGAMSFEALISLAAYGTQIALPRFVSVSGPSGSSTYLQAYALTNLIFSVAHAAARLFLLWGIVRLAQPPND